MSGYTTAWLLWIGFFLVIEGSALVSRAPGDTLSDHLRLWFATRNKPSGWRWRRLALAVGFLWLILHLFVGW